MRDTPQDGWKAMSIPAKDHRIESKVHALVEPVVNNAGFDLVELRMLRGPGGSIRLQLFIDSPTGVLVDHCAEISRKAGALLEVEDPIKGAYDLEVSSPGMKRLIRHAQDVERFQGIRARATLSETGESPRVTHIGTLHSGDETSLKVKLDSGEVIDVQWDEVHRVTLDPTMNQWIAIGEQQRLAAQAAATEPSQAQMA